MCRIQNRNCPKFLPYAVLVLSALALGIRALFSFCWSDEPFYFSTTHRFLQGDHIFVHEWFPTQLVSLILLPFQGLFEKCTGGTDGILLFFRLLYVLASLLIAIGVYLILRKKQGDVCALFCALFYQYYAHLNIATMSYYTLSVSFLLLSMLLLYGAYERQWSRGYLVAAGTVFALTVLSLPSLAVAYFLCTAALVIVSVRVKSLRVVFPMMLLGILIPAVAVLLYVLPTSGLTGLLDNLPFVLSDEEHVTSLVYPFKKFFLSVTDVYTMLAWCPVLLGALALGMELYGSFRKETPAVFERLRSLIFWADLALFLFFMTRSAGHTGYISTAVILFALPLFLLTKEKNIPLFLLVYAGGLILSMTFSYSSNGDLYVMTLGHSVSAVAGICFISDYAGQLPREEMKADVMKILCSGVILAALIQTMTLRFVNVYRDAPLSELTVQLKEGPAAGLYTTPEHAASYETVLSVIRENEMPGKNLFLTKLLPWGYLACDMNCAAPTTWRTKFSSERLKSYYELLPDKIPDVIIELPKEIGAYDTCGDVEADPAPNENDRSGWLYEYVNAGAYSLKNVNGITVYVRDHGEN